MRRHNPAVIPRNHHVEAALQAATGDDDLLRDGAAARRAGDPLRSRSGPGRVQRPGPGCARPTARSAVPRRTFAPPCATVRATRIRAACPSSPVSAWGATRSSPGRAPAPWARSIARATRASIGPLPSRSCRRDSRRTTRLGCASSRKPARSRRSTTPTSARSTTSAGTTTPTTSSSSTSKASRWRSASSDRPCCRSRRRWRSRFRSGAGSIGRITPGSRIGT